MSPNLLGEGAQKSHVPSQAELGCITNDKRKLKLTSVYLFLTHPLTVGCWASGCGIVTARSTLADQLSEKFEMNVVVD